MKTTKQQRISLATKMRQLRPDWSQDQLVIAITQAADHATTLPQLNAVGLIIARTDHTHPRTIVDDWEPFATLAAAAVDAAALTAKPAGGGPVDDPFQHLRRPDGTTDPDKQRAYIRSLLGLDDTDDQEGIHGTRTDGYGIAWAVGLDHRLTHDTWLQLDAVQRAAALKTWCIAEAPEKARTDAGLSLMLDVKAEYAEFLGRRAERLERERVARQEWDRKRAAEVKRKPATADR
jgi:hypothetical protein